MTGTLYGISVGPGDPELLTLKAVRLIEKCEIVAVPRTKGEKALALSIASQVCDFSKKTVVYLEFLMTKDPQALSQSHCDAAGKLLPYLFEGKDVAVLNIGDISVYSTFSYLAKLIREKSVPVSICPGITSFCAAAAAAELPLVSGGEILQILPAQSPDLQRQLTMPGTKVIMKSGKTFQSVAESIRKNCPEGRVTVIENCGMEGQRISGDLNKAEEYGYFTLIIVK